MVKAKEQNYYSKDRAELCTFLPAHYERALDIGCGAGTFRKHLLGDAEVWGIEPSPAAADEARGRLDKVLSGLFETVDDQIPDNYFDLVLCNDVIEHMVDHDWFLEAIKKKMLPQGYIVGSVPNVREYANLKNLLLHKNWEYEEQGTLDRTHLRFFTERSLVNTLTLHDYSIDKFEGINSALTHTRSLKPTIRNMLLRLLIFTTLGSYKDVQYRQFAFRAWLRKDADTGEARCDEI